METRGETDKGAGNPYFLPNQEPKKQGNYQGKQESNGASIITGGEANILGRGGSCEIHVLSNMLEMWSTLPVLPEKEKNVFQNLAISPWSKYMLMLFTMYIYVVIQALTINGKFVSY